MAAAGVLCGAVAARGSLHGWHALYNGTATAAMLIVALLPSRYLAVLFRAWPSLWVAVSFVMLPFHSATQQCALGYDTSPAAACVRVKRGEIDPAQLLPFLVHCAVGPGLRLPGFSCYLFLLLPVFGFIVMEVPQLTALSLAERVELSSGFFVSALLAAHGVLCCDAAERDAHNQRERVRAEKAATKEFTRACPPPSPGACVCLPALTLCYPPFRMPRAQATSCTRCACRSTWCAWAWTPSRRRCTRRTRRGAWTPASRPGARRC